MRHWPALFTLALIGLTSFVANGQDSAVDFKTGGNTWATSKIGDWVEYRTGPDTAARFTITAIAENGDITYEHAFFSGGKQSAKASHTKTPAQAPVQARVPAAGDIKWGSATYPIGKSTLTCETAAWTDAGSQNEVWFCRTLPCGGVVRTRNNGQDVIWLVAYGATGTEFRLEGGPPPAEPQPEPEPEPQPKPEPEPKPEPKPVPGVQPASDFGAPITMKLPDKVAKAMKDQGVAITRMRVYFDEEDNSNDGAVIEFEGMRTEVPVIYAAFKGDECDKEISYEDWLKRNGRFVDLAFEIKTRPAVLEGMKVQIVHSHLQGEDETELSTFDMTVPEPGEPWDQPRLRGALPGINRYTLVVTYTNSQGTTTTHHGFSHWVVVQAPPMFEFLNSVTAGASRTETGGNTVLDADVKMMGSFLLHHGLDAKHCTMRITRKGKRDMDLSKLPAEVRRAIDKESVPPGWQEVARVKFSEAIDKVGTVLDVEDSFVRVTWHHAFSASASVLPVTDEWEYRFELLHRDSSQPLATWTAGISVSIARPADISSAKLTVRATNLDKPLEIGFTKK